MKPPVRVRNPNRMARRVQTSLLDPVPGQWPRAGWSFRLNRGNNVTIARCIAASTVILLASEQLSARGNYHSEDRYNPQHISSLPPEVRNSVLHKCGAPKALHSFAVYFDNLKGVVLHFEHFVCDGGGTYCTASGCLHQVWVTIGGHYRLLRSYYAPEGE